MAETTVCPDCGAALPVGNAGGPCVGCLLMLAGAGDDPPKATPAASRPRRNSSSGVTPESFGDYDLLEEIGSGGMGVVWKARQLSLNRLVALKLIKPGMDSGQVLTRFDAERQALALMDHPNIARVIDAGTTPDGWPYFVMELVEGVPILRFCDERRLTIRKRLELFIQVCQAIQHAHQKGVIHRDIKPGNVLVTEQDGKAVPKVIDFGIAKAIGPRLTTETVATEIGALLGTLEYMSPEQASLNSLDIDTRSDIYSLGILLYELLTGTTPLTRQALKAAAFDEILRRIRQEDPQKPSTRLSESHATLAETSAQRRTDPSRLPRLLQGDVDWIVMKALEKERGRRFATANSFAEDIQRHLRHEPIETRRSGLWNRARKWTRRRPAIAALAAALIVTGVTGFAAVLWQLDKTDHARRVAEAAGIKALRETERATMEAETTRAINEFLVDDLLRQASSSEQVERGFEPKPGLTIREALDRASTRIGNRFSGRPSVEASILIALGQAYHEIGEAMLAIPHLERARDLALLHQGHDSRVTLSCMNALARAYLDAGQIEKSVHLHRETLAELRKKLGLGHAETLASMNNLAFACQKAGAHDEARQLFQEALQTQEALLGTNHIDTLNTKANLAGLYLFGRQFNEAIQLLLQVLAGAMATVGPDHRHTMLAMNSLASGYSQAGRLDLALPLFEKTLSRQRRVMGSNHVDTLSTMNNQASAYREANQLDSAIPLFQEVLTLRRGKLPPNHPDILNSMNNLANAYRLARQFDKSLQLTLETLTNSALSLGTNHPDTLNTLNNLGYVYRDLGQLDKALPVFEDALSKAKLRLGAGHARTLAWMRNLATTYANDLQFDRAVSLLEETLTKAKTHLGTNHSITLACANDLALVYRKAGKLEQALPLMEETLAGQRAAFGDEDAGTQIRMINLALIYLDLGRTEDAVPLVKETLTRLGLRLGAGQRETLSVINKLANALIDQQKHTEAESLLVECYESFKKQSDERPSPSRAQSVKEAGERVVQLYDQWGKPDQAAEWRKKLAELPAIPKPRTPAPSDPAAPR